MEANCFVFVLTSFFNNMYLHVCTQASPITKSLNKTLDLFFTDLMSHRTIQYVD